MIGERHLVEQLPVVIDVKGGPTAIGALHANQPVDGAPLDTGLPFGIRRPGVFESEQHHGGVVDIGKDDRYRIRKPSRRG